MLRSLAPPIFASPEQTLRARILHLVIGVTLLICVGFLPPIMVMQPETWSRGVPAMVFISCLGLALLRLNRSGRTRLASGLFIGGLIALMTALAVTAGGVRSPGVAMYFVIVLMAGLLLGERAGTVTAVVCAALGLGLLLAGAVRPAPARHSVQLHHPELRTGVLVEEWRTLSRARHVVARATCCVESRPWLSFLRSGWSN